MTKMVTLPQLGKLQANIKPLANKYWLETVYALHKQVREELPEEKKDSLLPRSLDYFDDLIMGRTGALFGALVDGKLVGMVAVFKSESWAAAFEAKRVSYPDADGAIADFCGHGTVGIIQSLCVLRAYKKNGIAQELLKVAKAWAKNHRCAHLFAQVAQDNPCSWTQFMKEDFEICKGWESVDHDRYLLRLAQRKASPRAAKEFNVAKHLAYPDGAASDNVIPFLNPHLAAGGRVQLKKSCSKGHKLYFNLV